MMIQGRCSGKDRVMLRVPEIAVAGEFVFRTALRILKNDVLCSSLDLGIQVTTLVSF